MDISKEALKKISLTKKEEKEIQKRARDFLNFLSKKIKKRIILGGSIAKNTLVKKEKQDVDIFVIFDNEEETKNLEEFLKKTRLKYEIFHGSRDYFQIEKDNLVFEIVPLVKIKKKENVKNVTDFSPLHVFYIKKKIKEKPFLANEIKLAKAFCQASEIYGAESYIKGFSGYAIEVLVCYYGSFVKFLKEIRKDNFIDIEKYFKNEKEARREINEQKILSPLILIDPVYKYRNLCAGLSEESFKILKEKAEEFLKKPSLDFFRKKEFNEKEFFENAKKNNLKVIILELFSSKEKEDIAATKMKKFSIFLKEEFTRRNQEVKDFKFVYLGNRESKVYFSLDLKEKIKVFGPNKELKEAVEKFKKVHEEIFFEEDRMAVYENFDLKEFLEKQKRVSESMDVEIKNFNIN